MHLHSGVTAMPSAAITYRLGIDIGGTFTDIVLLASDGSSVTRKVLSTPDDYARGIAEALREFLPTEGFAPERCREVVHGTTVATNAILEQKVARTGLLTTRGFRDVLELRRLRVPSLYNLRFRPPPPMVERRLRLEVVERMAADGSVLEPLDEASVFAAVRRLREAGVAAVAVSLLHSHRNGQHEVRVGEILRREMPNAFVSLSTEVLPEIREYERTSTTVINAAVGPVVRSYLESLLASLRGLQVSGPLKIMRSSGGTMSARTAMSRPAHIVESGPAAGTIAACVVGERTGSRDLIAFDMGGTTAKATLVEDGAVNLTTEYEVGAGISLSSRLIKGGGHALRLPVLDIAEVGAGGGSLVWVDRGGSLKVGPGSAGADPGPACYGLGGTGATVTDANLVLGYLNPYQLAGGALRLRPELAVEALEAVGRALGIARERAAFGVHTVANATMIRAIKAVTTYRGRDPRDFTLLAFGGSGPLHAASIARELGMTNVMVPPAPGLFSAVGLLQAPVEERAVQTFVVHTSSIDPERLMDAYRSLEAQTREVLQADGYEASAVHIARSADLRYVGQAYELTVPVDRGELDAGSIASIAERFGAEHQRVYGHSAESEPVELVNIRVSASVPNAAENARGMRPVAHPVEASERIAFFEDGWVRTPVLGRQDLGRSSWRGPLIIEDYDAATVVPPGCIASLTEDDCIVIKVEV